MLRFLVLMSKTFKGLST